ncbi:hypothetical protein Poly30_12860 [Planctomycetes bacterium Poly30]|uniref:Uncharacterized protein n=2 Tax=Saltatorellus ferox TaxID=2528018 RepID=A0A518ENX2_9BACT|nr:hypothetical protein Poly30_12860 [Planctomycetes bacterium Poly30]
MGDEEEQTALTAALIKLVLLAAVVTAPIFLFGEGFEPKYLWRVAASNGACVLLCLGLLALLKRGRTALAAGTLVYGLLALVGTLAWSNGEPVHVNVINFTLVAVLASVIAARRDLLAVGAISAALMVGIAWKQPAGQLTGEALEEARFESIVQFLPTFCVVIGVLWIGRRARGPATDSSIS